jgi:uncharacterized protein YukE
MSTLHMEVVTATNTQKTLADNYSQLNQLLTSTTSSVNALTSDWQGASATEFFSEYEICRKNIDSALAVMNDLAGRLKSEIAEWENMASKLSS